MKLIKFRIQNYKSIKDSDWCWLASGITIFAGKNESGKSASIEALQNFDTNEPFPDDVIPITEVRNKPTVEMCFDVETEILNDIAQETTIIVSKEVREYVSRNGVTITKYDSEYVLESDLCILLNKQRDISNPEHIKKIEEIIEELSEVEEFSEFAKPEININDIEATQQTVSQYDSEIRGYMATYSIPDEEALDHKVSQLAQEANALDKRDYADEFLDELIQYTPNILFFSESDILPFEISFEEAKNHPTVQDFAKVSGLDLDEVIAARSNSQLLRNMLSEKSAEISGDFMGYWEQNELDLIVEADGGNMRFGVKESGSTLLFKPEQRSKGFQWFLSFYLRLSAEQDEERIILVDEPGLHLHAKAQKDVLKVLEKISEESQVIFSTHSPYLIDAQHLDRVRLVLKNNEDGTRIENKIHKNSDKETLTPIITAMGLDLLNDFSIAGKKNVLLEGISDYYFLQALLHHTKKKDWNLIPSAGARKIPQLVSLLIGWDLDFSVVLDNDNEGRKVTKLLKNKLLLKKEHIVLISDDEGSSTEDLFTQIDFNEFVLEEVKNESKEVKNSKFLKINKLDKALLAKKFFEKSKDNKQKIDLSPDTINNFKRVFERIDAIFRENQ